MISKDTVYYLSGMVIAFCGMIYLSNQDSESPGE